MNVRAAVVGGCGARMQRAGHVVTLHHDTRTFRMENLEYTRRTSRPQTEIVAAIQNRGRPRSGGGKTPPVLYADIAVLIG